MSKTLFTQVTYNLEGLMSRIEMGEIGLPDLQRPFVWKNAKIRDLFDSMYRGFPVGYLLFWERSLANDFKPNFKTIGIDQKQKDPQLLVVDGQQRLTGLYAVIKETPVIRKNYKKEAIEIAFNPISETFEVADAAIRKDKSYIPNISKIWNETSSLFELTNEYLSALKTSMDVDAEQKKHITKAISSLNDIMKFPFTALELSKDINEKQAQEIFVRINSKGTTLNQADFILTLMSVFWEEGRSQIENFCGEAKTPPATNSASPFNHFIDPEPSQILRVSVGLGFKRAKLKYVYSILEGKDLETENFNEKLREKQFQTLKEAQKQVLNLQHWHDFMKVLLMAGYKSDGVISSQNNLLFCYTLYLMGRVQFKLEEDQLRATLAKWFFMTSMTGRYAGSPESKMEFDLARFREVTDGNEFIQILETVCTEKLTSDFWETTLLTELATSSPRSPSFFAYIASLNLLDAKGLFSKLKVSDLISPSVKAKKSALERHHLFPKSYLESIGIKGVKKTNQIANYALIEWKKNITISDKDPKSYLPEQQEGVSSEELSQMYYWHALPKGWEEMDYFEFLKKRREMIAKVIKAGYEKLASGGKGKEFKERTYSIGELVSEGENTEVEFKSTLRINLHTGEKDSKMEFTCLRAMAGFINRQGGTLFIGVADDGEPLGIEADKFPSEDKMYLHLDNLIKERLGSQSMLYIHPRFEDYQEKRVLAVECWPGKTPVFLKDGNGEKFFIRMGASTGELTGNPMNEYLNSRFNK